MTQNWAASTVANLVTVANRLNRWLIEIPENIQQNGFVFFRLPDLILVAFFCTWNRTLAMTSQCGWLTVKNSLITFVRISFGGTKSWVNWHNTFPYTWAAGRVANLMRWNRISIFSVVCIITSGSSCTMPLQRSVFSSCSFDPANRGYFSYWDSSIEIEI